MAETVKTKICVVTGSRAEYGLLYWLMREIDDDPELTLQLVVTGSHLSARFGATYGEIEKDGFQADEKIEIQLESDDDAGIARSMGLCTAGLVGALGKLAPDILVLLGDRFEIFAAAQAGMLGAVPIAHIHGGEVTTGAMDDAMRHAISKLSHLHFTASETYRQRVVQLGENPDRVFSVGAVGLDNIARLDLPGLAALKKNLGIAMGDEYFLITYHPETRGVAESDEAIDNLLAALDKFPDHQCWFTGVNADPGNKRIAHLIETFVEARPDRAYSFASLGQARYLSALKNAAAVVGNSSSGIIEAPYLGVPTVNIGNRQSGRLFAASVIQCGNRQQDIQRAIELAVDMKLTPAQETDPLPYGVPGASKRIKETLKSISLEGLLFKKFYDQPTVA